MVEHTVDRQAAEPVPDLLDTIEQVDRLALDHERQVEGVPEPKGRGDSRVDADEHQERSTVSVHTSSAARAHRSRRWPDAVRKRTLGEGDGATAQSNTTYFSRSETIHCPSPAKSPRR